jgi:predicted nicotinamide N-methyase
LGGEIKTETNGYGVRVLRSRHPAIRKLKRLHTPSYQGFRVWPSSWLLMDFLKHRGLPDGTRVMEVGCGWGMAGIYCAKQHGACVTAVDIDSEVFPFLDLHATINHVEINTLKRDFDSMGGRQLGNFDVLIGADICFWEIMIDSLKSLIRRALLGGTQMVLIADPGRVPFEDLGDSFLEEGNGEKMNWTVQLPHRIRGRILKIGSLES